MHFPKSPKKTKPTEEASGNSALCKCLLKANVFFTWSIRQNRLRSSLVICCLVLNNLSQQCLRVSSRKVLQQILKTICGASCACEPNEQTAKWRLMATDAAISPFVVGVVQSVVVVGVGGFVWSLLYSSLWRRRAFGRRDASLIRRFGHAGWAEPAGSHRVA